MRQLARIEQVKSVQPLKNSDNLDIVIVKGWKIVTKRNEFQLGEIGVYFEVDSFLPLIKKFEFLKQYCFAKSVNLKGEIIEGYRSRKNSKFI